MKYSFKPVNEDGSPRKCAGMWRPALDRFAGDNRERWLAGEFDRPLYEEQEPKNYGPTGPSAELAQARIFLRRALAYLPDSTLLYRDVKTFLGLWLDEDDTE